MLNKNNSLFLSKLQNVVTFSNFVKSLAKVQCFPLSIKKSPSSNKFFNLFAAWERLDFIAIFASKIFFHHETLKAIFNGRIFHNTKLKKRKVCDMRQCKLAKCLAYSISKSAIGWTCFFFWKMKGSIQWKNLFILP